MIKTYHRTFSKPSMGLTKKYSSTPLLLVTKGIIMGQAKMIIKTCYSP